jgi:hypothetical protein
VSTSASYSPFFFSSLRTLIYLKDERESAAGTSGTNGILLPRKKKKEKKKKRRKILRTCSSSAAIHIVGDKIQSNVVQPQPSHTSAAVDLIK